MTTPKTKSGAVGAVEHVIDKLLTHAEMVKGRPVNEATLSLLPSGEQCAQLAEWLGAALAELEKASDADKTAFDSSAWLGAANLEPRVNEASDAVGGGGAGGISAAEAIGLLRLYDAQVIDGVGIHGQIADALSRAVEDAYYEGRTTGAEQRPEADFSVELLWLDSTARRHLVGEVEAGERVRALQRSGAQAPNDQDQR